MDANAESQLCTRSNALLELGPRPPTIPRHPCRWGPRRTCGRAS
jgi:hypothetical protein